MSNFAKVLPGKLSNPKAVLESDTRLHPKIAQLLVELGGFAPGIDPISANATYAESLRYCSAFEELAALAHPLAEAAMPDFPSVESTTEVIKGVDDNDITLYLHKPKDSAGPVPCVVHTHGGGMVMMTAADPNFVRLRNTLAGRGMVAVGVEFRNGGGSLGPHPFPAGLNDCASAVHWVQANKERLGISNVIISGESGGGNLAIATTLKAKQEGWLEQIDGVFAMCPYISGAYANPPAELLSLVENDGYLLDCQQMAALVTAYDPKAEQQNNPLAWPGQATVDDLVGMPPHVVSVNELDPLRDEGLVYFRKLLAAGVPAVGRTVHGTPHAGDVSYPDQLPEIYNDTVSAIISFAHSL